MAKVNTGHNLPVGEQSWKFCDRCQSTVRDLNNHSKLVEGKMVPANRITKRPRGQLR